MRGMFTRQRLTSEALQNVTKLDLSCLGLVMIPDAVFEFRSLKILILLQNYIQYIPLELMKLRALEELDLSSNPITSLTNDKIGLTIKYLKNLKRFVLDRTELKEFPTIIFRIKSLNEVSVAGMELDTIPSQLAENKTLTVLNVSNNRVRLLPSGLGNFRAIRNLDACMFLSCCPTSSFSPS